MQQARVIGVPRSGTNFVKFVLEANAPIACRFNAGWWKHAVIPPLYEGNEAKMDALPTLVMFREPVAQMVAFFRFTRRNPGAIYSESGAETIGAFLRSPVRTDPSPGYSFRFASPVAYWEQFYYAALRWESPHRHFISLAAVQREPGSLLRLASAIVPGTAVPAVPHLPQGYLGRNPDVLPPQGFAYEAGTTREFESQDAQRIATGLTAEDMACVLTPEVCRLHAELEQRAFR